MQSSVPNNNLTVVGTVPGSVDSSGAWTPTPGGGADAGATGSHAYGYNGSGQLVTDVWTLSGVTRTKTYTYVAGVLTSESDWV